MIVADKVSREFQNGKVTALKEVSFVVESGECVGIIGRNGVGKTTLLRIAAGILLPSSGKIWTLGSRADRALEKNRVQMGCMFTSSLLSGMHTLRETYRFQQKIYRIPRAVMEEMQAEAGERLGITELLDVPLKKLSYGEQRRGEFLASIFHKPKLLLLDEPTIGMDKESRRIFNRTISYLNQQFGMTIVISSHDLKTLEQSCGRVLLLKKGRLSFDGKWELLRQRAEACRYVTFSSEKPVDMADMPIQLFSYEDGKTSLVFKGKNISIEGLKKFLEQQTRIWDFRIQEMEIEQVVYGIVGGGEKA